MFLVFNTIKKESVKTGTPTTYILPPRDLLYTLPDAHTPRKVFLHHFKRMIQNFSDKHIYRNIHISLSKLKT